jgi:hypothetical protein
MNNSRHIPHRPEMDTQEILRLYAEGFRLVCRYCKVEFTTIPETLLPGQTPQYVACPNNKNHMTILCEPAEAMKSVRERMASRSPKES